MKKVNLFLIVLFAFSFHTFAIMQTTGWRWRNDDGNLETATWMAGDTIPVTITSLETIRLRVRIDNSSSDNDFTTTGLGYGTKEAVILQYENNPASPNYTGSEDFHLTGDNESFTAFGADKYFEFVSSSVVTDGASTSATGILFTSLNTPDAQSAFSPGIFMSSSQAFTVTRETYTEIEYCFKPTANVVNGTYYFMGGGADNQLYPGANKKMKFPELIVDIATGIKDLGEADVKLLVTTDNIKIYDLPKGAINVNLYNTMGALVKTVKADFTNGAIDLTTNELAKGIYILNIQSADRKVQKKVFIN